MERHQFPPTRSGLTRKFNCGLDVYLTVNAKPDGEPAEIFVKLGKQGTTVSGLMQAWAVTVSAALQRGVEWLDLRDKYVGSTFEPKTHEYTSLVDAVARNVDELIDQLKQQADQQRGNCDSKLSRRMQNIPLGVRRVLSDLRSFVYALLRWPTN